MTRSSSGEACGSPPLSGNSPYCPRSSEKFSASGLDASERRSRASCRPRAGGALYEEKSSAAREGYVVGGGEYPEKRSWVKVLSAARGACGGAGARHSMAARTAAATASRAALSSEKRTTCFVGWTFTSTRRGSAAISMATGG